MSKQQRAESNERRANLSRRKVSCRYKGTHKVGLILNTPCSNDPLINTLPH